MIFITGPLYSGKRTFAGKLGGRQIFDVQNLAAQADDLEWLADELAADYDVARRRKSAAALCRWTRASGARGRRPGGWPACWRRARTR